MSPNRHAEGRVTIKDVARVAGVSPSTVSFVLNDTPGQTLRPATRDRVRAAARQLGYTPHGIARALREGTSRVVLLDLGPLGAGPSMDSFVEGMGEELSRLGHVLFVTHRETPSAPDEVIETFVPRAVVDIASPFATENPAQPDGGWQHGLPAHTMTQLRHLVRRGHRRIAFAAPSVRMPGYVAARLEHVARAAPALGIRVPSSLVVPDDPAAARDAVAALFGEPEPPTAVAAFDDDVALRVLAALDELGRAAPRDLAVIGFDASRYGALWRPALTSVRIDASGYGRRAARIALGMEGGPWPRDQSAVIVRDSA